MMEESEEVEKVEEGVAEPAEAKAPPKSQAAQKTTKPDPRPISRRTVIILSFCVGVLLVGFAGYWFLRDEQISGPGSQESMGEPQSGHVAESSVIPQAPPDQEPRSTVVPDTFATDPVGKTSLFAAYRDSLNHITDTLQGVFVSYDCDPTCFAWFDVKRHDGNEPRPFYCPFSTVSGYPLNRLPKAGASWTIITRETAIETDATLTEGSWPVVYEVIELRRAINATQAPKKPPFSDFYNDYEVDHGPVFQKSDPDAWAYLETRLYPEPEKTLGTTGMVMVSLIVGPDGKVRNVEIEEPSPYTNFNDEAIRLVQAMPAWSTPGRKNGKSVNVRVVVRVDFGPK